MVPKIMTNNSLKSSLPIIRALIFISLNPYIYKETASLARGYDGICAFVNADLGTEVIDELHNQGIRLILMRCAGYNNVDLESAQKYGIRILRVPGYSPEAVAEHAMALVLTANRHTHKAYIKCRENNFALNGLMGVNLYQKQPESSAPERSAWLWHASARALA